MAVLLQKSRLRERAAAEKLRRTELLPRYFEPDSRMRVLELVQTPGEVRIRFRVARGHSATLRAGELPNLWWIQAWRDGTVYCIFRNAN